MSPGVGCRRPALGVLASMSHCEDPTMIEGDPLTGTFTVVLAEIPPGHLTSYSVLSRVQKSPLQLESSRWMEQLRVSQIEVTWCALKDLADRRLGVKTDFDDNYHSVGMCDNTKVHLLLFWQARVAAPDCASGGHRKEKAFLRLLLHNGYVTHRRRILYLCADFMKESSEAFYTEFDCTAGKVKLSMLPVKPLIPRLLAGSVRLEGAYHLRRLVSDRRKRIN
ncbi:hypothetical protein DFH09DRAFT_1070072 [Mycena vulgaris]|nr:hypothetical protein DFH09DRAFT_1070072 [Mycena vulgaris]